MSKQIPLKDVVLFHYGSALKAEDRDENGTCIVFGSNGPVGRHSNKLIDNPTLIIGRKGSVGSIYYAEDGGWPIDTTYYTEILDPTKLNLRYLYYALKQAGLDRHTIVTSIPGLNRDALYRTTIPLPPLPEQKRIADILDKADAILRKRRESTIETDRLLHSWFMSTVGPDSKGFSNWPIRSVEDLAVDKPGSMRTGPFGSDLKHSEFVNEGIAVLGIDNAVQNRFTWSERRFISEEKYIQLSRYRVYPGDVIITIMGTVGRSAVVPDDIPEAINTKHLACITANRKEVEPEFLSQSFFRHPEVLRQLGLAGRGAIMTGLNLGIIKNIRLSVPPISVQRQFAAGVAAIRKHEFKASLAAASSDSLFNSLIDRCFRGE